jgi:hypothetical protein
MTENGTEHKNEQHTELPAHPFVGISPIPRLFVYVIGVLTVSIAYMVFTESYLRFINGLWWQAALVILGYGIATANLNFYIIRRLARKLFEPHKWVYFIPVLFSIPWGIWSYFKEDFVFGYEWVIVLALFLLSSFIGTAIALKKAAVFRKDFLEKWHAELKRQIAEQAERKQ